MFIIIAVTNLYFSSDNVYRSVNIASKIYFNQNVYDITEGVFLLFKCGIPIQRY